MAATTATTSQKPVDMQQFAVDLVMKMVFQDFLTEIHADADDDSSSASDLVDKQVAAKISQSITGFGT